MSPVETNIPGVWTTESLAFKDDRGAFSRLFCSEELQPIIQQRNIVQINRSNTHGVGVVRGFHFQKRPYAELKIIRCLRGRVFDVAVDLRQGSQTFLCWTAVELTPENNRVLIIPEGCAHGFQVLEADSELLYLHTAFYTPQAEGGVRFDDPRLGVKWPLTPINLSARDLSHPYLTTNFKGIPV